MILGRNIGTWDGTGEAEPWRVEACDGGALLIDGARVRRELDSQGSRVGADLLFVGWTADQLREHLRALGWNVAD